MSYSEKQAIKHITAAIKNAESHHGTESGERLAELEKAIEDGRLLTLGEFSLMGADVDVSNIKSIMDADGFTDRNFAVLVLGKNTRIAEGSNVICSAIIDSTLDSTSEVTDGSVVINSELKRGTHIRDTLLEDTRLTAVRGSSGGNEITGDIEFASIAASGNQVFVTPYPKRADW